MPAQPLRRVRSRIVVYLLLHHRSVDIIRTKPQRDLRHLRRHHLPVALNVRKVIQHQPAHRNLTNIRQPTRLRQMPQRRVVRMKAQRDERLKSTRIILHLAKPHQVVHAVLIVLDMAVQHRRIRPQPSLVHQPRRLQPLAAIDLVVADNMPHAVRKDLRSAARTRIHPRGPHLLDHLRNRNLPALGQERNLHHRERLHMHLRIALLQTPHQIHEVRHRQIRMQPTHNVELRHSLRQPLPRSLPCLFKSHRVRVGLTLFPPKRAQSARRNTDVRRIDMPVHIEVRQIPMHPLAHQVRHPAHCQDVAAAVQRDAIIEVQALSPFHFSGNGFERRIIRLKTVPRARRRNRSFHLTILPPL